MGLLRPVITNLFGKASRLTAGLSKSCCAPGVTRTPDPRIRNPLLYPAELRAQNQEISVTKLAGSTHCQLLRHSRVSGNYAQGLGDGEGPSGDTL